MTISQEWWTCRELAAHWRVSVDTIKRRIKDGEVRAMCIGATHRIHISEIQRHERNAVRKRVRPERPVIENVPDLIGSLDED